MKNIFQKPALGLFTLIALIAAPAARAEDKPAEEKKTFKDIVQLSGQFNTSYNYNFNSPFLGAYGLAFSPNANNTMRVFDIQANNFYFNLFDLGIEVTPTDYLKFRLDINLGQDVAVVDSLKGGGIGTDEFGLEQAFVEATAPVGRGLTFKLGHFVTPLGYEVIESASNWNTSRAFLFGFAIPFTHSGLLITYPFADQFSMTVGVVNGWDVVSDNNKGKTFIGQLLGKPTENLTLSLQGTVGPEQNNNSNIRGILDFVLTWSPIEKVTLGFNYDWAHESFGPGVPSQSWQGLAGYVHVRASEHFGFTGRGEWFQDDGSRVGTVPGVIAACAATGSSCTNFDLFEGTGTFHYYITEGWETRFEYRHDTANQPIFARSAVGTYRKYQDTLSAEVLYSF